MKLTILFDLDGTLLLNQVEVFLPAYLDLLSHHLVSWPADQVVKHLLAATNRMVKEPASGRTLEEIFDGHFFPALGTTRAALQPEIDFFYEYVYPGLREHTRPQPGAKELIDLLVRKGHDLVIATNPVFPATAIHQRLEWAGFQPDQNPFKLISNFSDFHFSKPHPAFFAEILARLGWVDQPAVMIGDSLTEDIIPAAALGLPVYWINTEGSLPENLHSLSRSGSFAGILDWIESVEQSLIEKKLDSRQAVEAVLKATPAVLDYLIRSLPESRWKSRPGPDEWCLTEIICHLRDVDLEVNLPRIELISEADDPFLPGISTDHWAFERKYCQQESKKALTDFDSGRTQLLEVLSRLKPDDWHKPAHHAIFGPTQLLELMSFIATHDKNHIQQAFRSVSS